MNDRVQFALPAWAALLFGCSIGMVALLATGAGFSWTPAIVFLVFATVIWFVPEMVDYFTETRPRRKREKAIADFVEEMERNL